MKQIADFINHGIIPLTGQREERDQLRAFWRGIYDAYGLRAMVLEGEAGSGKSRLVSDLIPDIVSEGGIVFHVKLYPDSAISLASLIAESISYSEEAKYLLKQSPEPTLLGITSALRHLSRLRPLLLIVEDAHLLDEVGTREFASLTRAIEDDLLSLLIAVRPVEFSGRTVLEPFLAKELILSPLDNEHFEELWLTLFESKPSTNVIDALQQATKGNMLAFRSVLRSLLRSELLYHERGTGLWKFSESKEHIQRLLDDCVERLAEGMLSHLSEEERHGAMYLSELGAIFAFEAADEMIEHAEDVIGALIEKGIIATTSNRLAALPGESSERKLLSFTSSIVYEYLLAGSNVQPEYIAAVIATNVPLYSYRPFLDLTPKDPADVIRCPKEELESVVHRTISVAHWINGKPDFGESEGVVRNVELLFNSLEELLSDEERVFYRSLLLNARLSLSSRDVASEANREFLNELFVLTENSEDERIVEQRMKGYTHSYRYHSRRGEHEQCRKILFEAEEFVETNPILKNGRTYHKFLADVANAAVNQADEMLLREVEQQMEEILSSDELSDEERIYVQHEIGHHLLHIYSSDSELEKRLTLAEDILNNSAEYPDSFLISYMSLLDSVGSIHEAAEIAESALEDAQKMGLGLNVFQCRLTLLCADGALGRDLEELFADALELCRNESAEVEKAYKRHVGIYLMEVGLLRNDKEWTRKVVEEFSFNEIFWPEVAVFISPDLKSIPSFLTRIPSTSAEEQFGEHFLGLVQSFLRSEASFADMLDEYVETLNEGHWSSMRTLLLLHGVLALLSHDTSRELKEVEMLDDAMEKALEWLAGHRLHAYMSPFVESYGEGWPKKKKAKWRGEIRKIEEQLAERSGSYVDDDEIINISMLGKAAVQLPNEEWQNVRGARGRMLLGVLVAEHMMESTLTNEDFCRIVAGRELDIDLARKTTNMAVVRIREAFGSDVILTGKDKYTLNCGRVRVDVLEAHEALKDAVEGLRTRSLMRVGSALLKCLTIIADDVLFPELYDDFFEAVREDFESKLRNTVLNGADVLLSEGDVKNALDILRATFQVMPEDEELSELYRKALAESGQRADAELVRLRTEEVLVS